MTDDKRIAEIRGKWEPYISRPIERHHHTTRDIRDLFTALDATTARLRAAEGLLKRARSLALDAHALGKNIDTFLKGATNG